jgi:hypothetical protein
MFNAFNEIRVPKLSGFGWGNILRERTVVNSEDADAFKSRSRLETRGSSYAVFNPFMKDVPIQLFS